MGILRESAEEDIADITWVAKWSASAWNHYAKSPPNPAHAGIQVEVNENVISGLSDVGAKVLSKHFPDPDLIVRIATLVAVATCCPPFSLRRKGKLIGMEERRACFAIIALAFVNAAFVLYRPGEGSGAHKIRFKHEASKERFLAYLQLMDVMEITGWDGKNSRKEEEYLRHLAKDILGISEFMSGFIEFDGAGSYEEPPLLGGSVVPA